MAEERPVTGDRIMEKLDAFREQFDTFREQVEVRFANIEKRFGGLEHRMARLEGGFEQMDRRVSSLESLQRWAVGLIVTTWLTVSGLIIAVLSKLP